MSPTCAPPVSPVSHSEKTLPSCNRLTFTVARIGDNSFVGPFVEIQKGVRIGQRCRIQSHAFICELVVIGDDCFVSHGAMFINDLFDTGGPAGGDRNLWKETKIGNHVSIGTNATILPVTICDHVVMAQTVNRNLVGYRRDWHLPVGSAALPCRSQRAVKTGEMLETDMLKLAISCFFLARVSAFSLSAFQTFSNESPLR